MESDANIMFNFEVKDDKNSNFIFDEDVIDNFKKEILNRISEELKRNVLEVVIPSLGPKNFEGEAITYLQQTGLPITKESIKQYSNIMLKSFIDNIDDMIIYDEEKNMLIISPFIEAFEYGDFYRPVLKTITHALEEALKTDKK